MADVSHVVFSVRQWWTTHDVSLMVWVLSFGLIRCMVSEILQFLDFGNWVGLKKPIDAPFGGFWGTLSPNDVTHRPNPKTAILGLNHVIWATKREYRSRGSSWALDREKKRQYRTAQEKVKWVIFRVFGDKSHQSNVYKNLERDVFDVITCANFQNKIFRGYVFTGGSNGPFSYWFFNNGAAQYDTYIRKYCTYIRFNEKITGQERAIDHLRLPFSTLKQTNADIHHKLDNAAQLQK